MLGNENVNRVRKLRKDNDSGSSIRSNVSWVSRLGTDRAESLGDSLSNVNHQVTFEILDIPRPNPYYFVPLVEKSVSYAPVAQLDRASDFGSEGWGFDSLRVHLESNLDSEAGVVQNMTHFEFGGSPPDRTMKSLMLGRSGGDSLRVHKNFAWRNLPPLLFDPGVNR